MQGAPAGILLTACREKAAPWGRRQGRVKSSPKRGWHRLQRVQKTTTSPAGCGYPSVCCQILHPPQPQPLSETKVVKYGALGI